MVMLIFFVQFTQVYRKYFTAEHLFSVGHAALTMPPCRKRRDSRKGPLRFIESPVHIPHGVQSPVFASDNPCTADVVPIDDATANWVITIFHFMSSLLGLC